MRGQRNYVGLFLLTNREHEQAGITSGTHTIYLNFNQASHRAGFFHGG
jgi:hypothetical protein